MNADSDDRLGFHRALENGRWGKGMERRLDGREWVITWIAAAVRQRMKTGPCGALRRFRAEKTRLVHRR